MINLHAAQLLSLPQGAKSDVAPKLPWPNGSIITAKMTPTDSEGSVIISLGGYRMRAQVPPNTPMGNIWLQLMNRDMPVQFRLLSDSKAVAILGEMLAKQAKPDSPEESIKHASRQAADAWSKMDMDGLPVRADASVSERYMMLCDRDNGETQGMLNKQVSDDQFHLHGRVDLKHMGAVAFSLQGKGDAAWNMHVYIHSPEHIDALRNDFSNWLSARHDVAIEQSNQHAIDGAVMVGMPDDFELLGDLKA